MKTTDGESYDYAAVWWNGKAQKYQGIWCADINDEGCNGFDAALLGNQVIMTGEWEQKGKRRAIFGLVAVTAMLVSYALEKRSHWFKLPRSRRAKRPGENRTSIPGHRNQRTLGSGRLWLSSAGEQLPPVRASPPRAS